MTIKTSQAVAKRKVVYTFLAQDAETQKLLKDLPGNTANLHLTTWQEWGWKLTQAWESKEDDYIIWPHQTSRHERWVVLVINCKDGKAAIHTASKAADAKAEQVEILNYLSELKGYKGTPNLDTDDGAANRTDRESALLAILYIKEILKELKTNSYEYDIDNSIFDEETDGKIPLTELGKEYDQLLTELKATKSVRELEENQEKHTEKDLEKHTDADLLTDDQKKKLKEYDGLKEDRDKYKQDYENEQKETTKLKDEKKELIKLGTEATQKITKLEEEAENLKKQLEAKPTPQPIPNGGGTPTPAPVIAGADEWIATAKFLTEPNFGKAIKYFNDLYDKKWTEAQREAIYRILKANKDNREWAKGKWGQHFNH